MTTYRVSWNVSSHPSVPGILSRGLRYEELEIGGWGGRWKENETSSTIEEIALDRRSQVTHVSPGSKKFSPLEGSRRHLDQAVII